MCGQTIPRGLDTESIGEACYQGALTLIPTGLSSAFLPSPVLDNQGCEQYTGLDDFSYPSAGFLPECSRHFNFNLCFESALPRCEIRKRSLPDNLTSAHDLCSRRLAIPDLFKPIQDDSSFPTVLT